MGSNRGVSFIDLLVTLGVLGVVSAAAIPSMSASLNRNQMWTGADIVAGEIRTARLSAISRNAKVRVRFNCPTAGHIRVLAVTGDSAIDNATNRCSTTQPQDGPEVLLPARVSVGNLPTLEISNRGAVTVASGSLPLDIVVGFEGLTATRTVRVYSTGRVRMLSSDSNE